MQAIISLKEKFSNLSAAKKVLVVTLLLVLIVFSAWAGYIYGYKKIFLKDEAKSPKAEIITETPQPETVNHPINGVVYSKKDAEVWQNRIPLGVMVENSIVARPQRGLSKADIVYETLAEGDITRFVAIFHSTSTQMGPVRSAREYYFDWTAEYNAAYAHWGGNAYVRSLAKQVFGQKDLDQFDIGGAAFYRIPANSRSEHSGHSNTDKLWEVATNRGVNAFTNFETWKFKEDTPVNPPTHPTINIGFRGNYSVRWDYDSATNSYKRLNGGVPHIDQEHNAQITAKTIVVNILENQGYKQVTPGVSNRSFKTIGSGAAKIYQDGTLIEGSWKKDSREARTKLFDAVGQEIELNRGTIWMEMVPNDITVS